jgi:DNA polymerase-3 subunit delta
LLNVYFGEESFLIHQSIQKKQREFNFENHNSLTEIFNGDENPVGDFLLSISRGGGLFVQKKLVIMKDIFEYDQGSQEKILKFFQKKDRLFRDIEIIISWSGKVRANKLLNWLKKNGKIKEFKKATPFEVERFILNKLEGKNQIDQEVIKKMILFFSSDLWRLDRELEKLINFNPGKKINKSDFDTICEGSIGAKIFDLIDAIGNKNKKRALELLNSLTSQGEDVFYILSMIVFQVRNLILVLDCKKRGVFNSKEIAQRVSLHPYVVQKSLAQLKGFDLLKLKKIYQKLFSLDINSKSGKINLSEALEDFIVKI